jgi:hypothetical protein
MPRSLAASTIASASGCSDARSTRRQAAAVRLRHSRSPARSGDRRPAFGQRAGLVDDQRIDFLHVLERFGILDQHAQPGAAAPTMIDIGVASPSAQDRR